MLRAQTGTQILLDAMSKDKVHLARFVLDALDGEIVDSRTEGKKTPLISSILLPDAHTRCKFVELLLQRGANVNCRDGSGRTALSYACENGYVDAVKILVRNNADPEIVDVWGNTPLMYAAVAGHSLVVEFLVRAFKRLGLQIDRQNKVGNSAVEVAKFLGHTDCIFALTSGSRKGREPEGARGRRDGRLGQNCSWQPRPQVKQSGLPSMDSIEEFDRENGGSSSPPQVVFSEILTPKSPTRSLKLPKIRDEHLPPLKHSSGLQKSMFFSPRPIRNPSKSSPPSALDVLLSPILSKNSEPERSNMLELDVRRYHEKRCSLPTSLLSPTPRDHVAVPARKSRPVGTREASPSRAERLQFGEPTPATSATTFSLLSNKLLRRFTSPELKKEPRELEETQMLSSGRIPRSETFPQAVRHLQVGSKPSIDSISSVHCEFGFVK